MDEPTTGKIRLKIGQIELEYEGSEQFLKNELPALLKVFSDLKTISTPPAEDPGVVVPSLVTGNGATKNLASTSTAASKLSCKTGTELVLAGAVYLTMGAAQSTFGRREIIKQMKSATTYYLQINLPRESDELPRHARQG